MAVVLITALLRSLRHSSSVSKLCIEWRLFRPWRLRQQTYPNVGSHLSNENTSYARKPEVRFNAVQYWSGASANRYSETPLITGEDTYKSLRIQPSTTRAEFIPKEPTINYSILFVGEALAPQGLRGPHPHHSFKLFCFLKEARGKKV